MRKAVVVIAALLILFSLLCSIQSIQSSKAEYTLIPKFTLESPQNNTVIRGTDSTNITLTWETVFGYDYYYSIDTPIIIDKPYGKIPLNLTITSEKPLAHNNSDKTYRCNIQLQNLTDGKHSVTLYYAAYDPIITNWRHISPGATIVFSIESSTPTPTVPEFSWLAIIPLMISMLSVAIAFRRHRKTISQNKPNVWGKKYKLNLKRRAG